MKITDTKINGITNPIGFSFPSVKCSWKVTDARGCHQSNVKIMIASDAALENIITVKEGRELKSIGERLEVELKPRTRYYYNVKVTDESGDSARSETAWFETGKMGEPVGGGFYRDG